jgi:hypothetical protein
MTASSMPLIILCTLSSFSENKNFVTDKT